ncbi:MAG TPA: ribbon-helix-helix protein, CopG family [Rhodothermales bacterium]|nr:ribbon-helix-helix protein, CopG family [Rhodothermales bacterium]
MKTITLQLPDDTVEKIDKAARSLGLSVEALVHASVEEKLDRLALNLDEAAEHVLKKNAELYRRLA